MKKIIFLLLIDILFGFASSIFAQPGKKTVSGTFKGNRVKVVYVSDEPSDDIKEVKCNGEDLDMIFSRLNKLNAQIAEKDKEIKKLEKKIQDLSQNYGQGDTQIDNPNPKVVDSLFRQNKDLLDEKWKLEDQRNDLQDSVQNLKKSVRLLNDSLEKVNKQLADLLNVKPTKNTSSHVGAYYRIGSPLLFNSLLNQKEGSERFWHRQMTLSHQIGVYWNSASFSDKLPMTYGVGLEYNRMKFSAGIGHLKDTLRGVEDDDGDFYTAYYTYSNVAENATLHGLSIPLSFSIGAPRTDRISGYFQVSLVPSILFSNLSASGVYSQAGLYENIGGTPVTLYLDDFAPLGFCSDSLQRKKPEEKDVLIPFTLSGRLAGGVYLPLCNTTKGQASAWVIKVGVNLDMGFLFSKQKEAKYPKAKYHLDQYNIVGSGACYFNPGLEVGILYMFNK